MSTTLLRLGLWTLILVMVLYVLATSSEEPWVELIPMQMLQQVLMLAGIVIVAGIVLRILGVGAKVVTKNRCRICRTPIPFGAIYCREHLRNILEEEDEKTHQTRVRH